MARSCRRISLTALALVVTLSPDHPALGQAPNPIVGTWLLDRGQSEFVPENDRLLARTMIFEATDNGLTCTIITENIQRYTAESKYTAHFDGKDVSIDNSTLDFVSLRRMDANTMERTGKRLGKAVETATMKVSPDGKTLTVTTKGAIDGDNYSSTQVFKRK